MSATTIVTEDSTETLVTYPPTQWLAQASEADVRIGTPGSTLPEVGGEASATVDAVSASTSAAAKEGDNTLTFASDPTATAGRLYPLSHSTFKPFLVEVVSSGTTTVLARPLTRDIPSGATFKGVAITKALTATQTAEVGVSVAYWRATLDGVQRTWVQRFHVWPRAFAQRLTPPELLRRAPEVEQLRNAEDTTLTELIASGYEWLVDDLEAAGFQVHKINSVEKLNGAVVRRILWGLYCATQKPSSEDAKEAKADYLDAKDKAIRSSEFWYDRDLTEYVPEKSSLVQPGARIVL